MTFSPLIKSLYILVLVADLYEIQLEHRAVPENNKPGQIDCKMKFPEG